MGGEHGVMSQAVRTAGEVWGRSVFEPLRDFLGTGAQSVYVAGEGRAGRWRRVGRRRGVCAGQGDMIRLVCHSDSAGSSADGLKEGTSLEASRPVRRKDGEHHWW